MKVKAVRVSHDNQCRIDAKVSRDAQACANAYLQRKQLARDRATTVVGAIALAVGVLTMVVILLAL
jgi:hypothetical protein